MSEWSTGESADDTAQSGSRPPDDSDEARGGDGERATRSESRQTADTDYEEYEDELAVYEWAGMLIAGLGFFLSPLFTALPAAYCAQKIRHWKPITALLIAALILSTVVFWLIVVIFIFPSP